MGGEWGVGGGWWAAGGGLYLPIGLFEIAMSPVIRLYKPREYKRGLTNTGMNTRPIPPI